MGTDYFGAYSKQQTPTTNYFSAYNDRLQREANLASNEAVTPVATTPIKSAPTVIQPSISLNSAIQKFQSPSIQNSTPSVPVNLSNVNNPLALKNPLSTTNGVAINNAAVVKKIGVAPTVQSAVNKLNSADNQKPINLFTPKTTTAQASQQPTSILNQQPSGITKIDKAAQSGDKYAQGIQKGIALGQGALKSFTFGLNESPLVSNVNPYISQQNAIGNQAAAEHPNYERAG